MLIGIAGEAGAGKDTFAKILKALIHIKEPNRKVYIMRFADPVKKIGQSLFDVKYGNDEELDELLENAFVGYLVHTKNIDKDRKLKETKYSGSYKCISKITPRQLFQIIGEEFRNKISENIWVDHLIYRYDYIKSINPNSIVIVPDVRYKNEAEAIFSRSGIVIRVYRDKREKNVGISGHPSENLSWFDEIKNGKNANMVFEIDNNEDGVYNLIQPAILIIMKIM